uniref:Pumilio homolog 24-like isoform X1 n=1 Tax=Rhizophora mucronata TaxID=61149 RepID=A0A2P2KVF8_RHIMU
MKSLRDEELRDKEGKSEKEVTMSEASESTCPENLDLVEGVHEGGKKDPSLRRRELLVNSGLAESLIETCTKNAGQLLRSNVGKEVLYEVVTGGSNGILQPTLDDKLNTLHETIASLAAESESEESHEEHVLENFHSSRTIRKLVLNSPTFATTLWMTALKGNCGLWAQGHSSKVIHAYLESSDAEVRELAKTELKPLVARGILKMPERSNQSNEI